jgi:hypothetical protein
MSDSVTTEQELQIECTFTRSLHGEWLHNAKTMLKLADDKKLKVGVIRGRIFKITSVIYSAFALEALLNFLGTQKLTFWDAIEHLKWGEKMELLARLYDVKLEKGKRPYQTVVKMFNWRNRLAHGKTDVVKTTLTMEQGDPLKFIETGMSNKWLDEVGENAKMIREDVEAMMLLFGMKPEEIRSFGSVEIRKAE